ncbi:MAG: SpoIIE family protein phosphatase [Thermomicrobiales bacterium]|nr:SpoIIE family protein phosphatase [Thermomicrobiales bacterium]
MGYRYDIAIRSTHKYAVRACGDVTRVVDLPDGGLALVVIDGQGSGPSARAVARGVAAHLSEALEAGTSAEVAAMAANQALAAGRSGQVSVSFDVVRASATGEIDIARFSTNAVFKSCAGTWSVVAGAVGPAGRSASATPDVVRLTVDEADGILVATDGVAGLGADVDAWLSTEGLSLDPLRVVIDLFEAVRDAANERPKDDVTVAALACRRDPADQRIERLNYSREVR